MIPPTGSSESREDGDIRILVCGPNWLGDGIMCMPALQALRAESPQARIDVLSKPYLTPLWGMHPAVGGVIELETGLGGTQRTVKRLSAEPIERAYIFPNSFRSALLPCLAGIRHRVGMKGHRPRLLLSRVVKPPSSSRRRHQAWEYMAVAGLAESSALLPLDLRVPEEATRTVRERFALAAEARRPLVGLIPGAAYGPSKRWPVEHFIATGQVLAREAGARIVVMGTRREGVLCSRIVREIGGDAVDIAGKTSIVEFAALLGLCRAVVTNDSGGMHLAAAVGTRVVAIFGITDPQKTAPLGKGHRVISRPDVEGSRDIDRRSRQALAVLQSISPRQVVGETLALLG